MNKSSLLGCIAILALGGCASEGEQTASSNRWTGGTKASSADARAQTATSEGSIGNSRASEIVLASNGAVDASRADNAQIADALVGVSRPTRSAPVVGVWMNTAFVQFESGSAEITPAFDANLHKLGAALEDNRLAKGCLTFAGHTDATGTDAVNIPLSKARAQALMKRIRELGYKPRAELKVIGYGSNLPRNPNNIRADENRRVEIESCLEE